MRAALLTILLTSSALGGCLGADDADEPSSDSRTSAEWPFEEATSGCDDVSTFFLVPIDHVASLLPPGFEPLDASYRLPAEPTSTGQGMIAFSSLHCRVSDVEANGTAYAGLFVLVEPPELPDLGIERRPRGFEAYLAGLWTTSPTLAARIGPVGHDIHHASVANAVAEPPQAGPVSLSVEDEDGALASVTGTAPRPISSPPGGTNTWQVTEAGLLHLGVSWSKSRDFGQGAAVHCDLRPGSRVAEVLGFTDCAGQKALSSGAVDDAYTSAWTYFPGVAVGGGGG